MVKKTARKLWEDILINGTAKKSIKDLSLNKEHVNFFISHTMPEMFVDKDINILYTKKAKELEEEQGETAKKVKRKKIANLFWFIGISLYLIIVAPILLLIAVMKYY